MGLLLDEDELSDEGTRANPTFKCKPDIYSLLSGVKPGYAVLFKTKWLLNQPSDDNNASLQDWIYKKFLQLVQQHSPEAIKHLPVVALHTVPELCAHKPVRHTAEQCLAAEQQKPEVMEQASGLLRLQWPLPEPAPLVSVLIPTKDRLDILKPCLDTLLSVTEYPDFEVLILDNQTTCPEALAFMKVLSEQDARVHVLPWNYPFNFAAINNFGAKHAKGSVLALVNNDIEPISPHWLQEMVSLACLPDTGCVGAKLYYPNGAIQHAGVVLGLGGVAGHSDRFSPGNAAGYLQRLQHVREVSAVTAACLVVKKELFERVGGMNEEHLAVNYNDIDFCLKVNALGYKNLWTPHAELVHHESVSRGPATSKAHIKRARQEADYMYKTWGNRLCADPFYSPNFSLIHEEVSLRAVE
ncbi:family 2 glycosyl transferase [Oceanimonas sp. GK1]|nr:family 2 glycosyl transferase [Oceanimonas sp. GK1]